MRIRWSQCRSCSAPPRVDIGDGNYPPHQPPRTAIGNFNADTNPDSWWRRGWKLVTSAGMATAFRRA